jgi:hypothetical protein
MSDELIDRYIDRDKIKSDTDFLEAEAKKAVGFFDAIKQAKSAIQSADSVKGISDAAQLGIKANAQLNESTKAVINLVNQRFATEAKLVTLQTDYAKQTIANRLEIQKTTKELKAQAEAEEAPIGSRNRALAQIKVLTHEKDKLNLVNAEERKQYDEIVVKLERYEQFLKSTGSALEKQRLNIGNYAGSLAKPFESLQTILAEIKTGLQNGTGLGGGKDEASLKAAATAAGAIETALDKAGKKGATATAQVKALEGAFQSISLSTTNISDPKTLTATNDFLNRFKKEVGEAKDSVQDLKDEIKLNASDTKGIDNIVGSLNGLVGVAQGAAGAYVLLGGSQEDAAKVTAKLLALQGIANSVQQVGAEITRRGSIAYTALASVQGVYATATDRSAAATVRLAAAGKLLTGGIIIAVLAAMAIAFYRLKDSAAVVNRELELNKELNKEVAKSAGTEIAQLQKLYAVATNTTLSIKERKNAVDELQKQYPEHFKNIKDEIILQGQAKAAYNATEQAILENAKTRAVENKLAELANKELEINFEREDKIKEIRKAKAQKNLNEKKANTLIPGGGGEKQNVSPEDFIKGDLAVSSLNDQLLESNDELKKIATDRDLLLKQIKTATTKTTGGGGGTDVVKPQKIKDNTAAEILNEQYQRNRLLLEDNANTNKAIFENEKIGFDKRIEALKRYSDDQKQIIELDKQFQIAQEGLKLKETLKSIEDQKKDKGANVSALNAQAEKEKIASAERIKTIELKSNLDLSKIQKESAESYNSIVQKYFEQRKAMFDKEVEEFKAREKKKKQIAKDLQETDLNNDELALRDQAEQDSYGKSADIRKRIEEKLQNDITDLRQKSALVQLQLDEKELERKKALMQLFKINTAEIEKLITQNKLEQSKIRTGIVKGETTEEEKLRNETADKVQFYESAAADLIQGLYDANATREKNRIQEQIDALEKKKNIEIDAVNKSTASQEEKANRIQVINAVAQAKKEQLEERQRKIDMQRAKFEKEMGILQIIVQIGVAIAKQQYAAAALAGVALIKAIATPLPKFFRGKSASNKYEGMAVTNDSSHSNFIEPIYRHYEKKFEIPTDRNHITYLAKDDIVYSSIDEMIKTHPNKKQFNQKNDFIPGIMHHDYSIPDSLQSFSILGMMKKLSSPPMIKIIPSADINSNDIKKELIKQSRALNIIAGKKELNMNVTEKGIIGFYQHGMNRSSYINDETNWNKK